MSSYFITSTGTGLGKTFTTCALLEAARVAGRSDVRGYKPIISGWDESGDTDTAKIIAAQGCGLVKEVSPWRLKAPLSPHRAAALEKTEIPFEDVLNWCYARAAQPGLNFIEGVGGVMVPLNDSRTVLDWMAALKLPVVLVVGSYLGTISHTLTALAVLRAAGISVAALVLNETVGSAVPLVEAEAGLAPFIRDIHLRVTQPLVSSPRDATEIHRLLEMLT